MRSLLMFAVAVTLAACAGSTAAQDLGCASGNPMDFRPPCPPKRSDDPAAKNAADTAALLKTLQDMGRTYHWRRPPVSPSDAALAAKAVADQAWAESMERRRETEREQEQEFDRENAARREAQRHALDDDLDRAATQELNDRLNTLNGNLETLNALEAGDR